VDKVNLLLVDDQPGKLLAYQALLADLGENIVLARSGREALQCLLKEEFALILLDVMMPELDGFETAALIRQRPRLEDTPIIFLTAYSTSDIDRLKGYELGAVDYVFAPVVPEILRAKVSVFVELYRKRNELARANDRLRAEIAVRKSAEDRLRESEERFRLMVESVKDYAIFMLDRAGRVLTWNAGAERLMGYQEEEIVGQHFARFYPPKDVEGGKPDGSLRAAVAEGRHEDEGWRVRKDGTLFWANTVLAALFDSEGYLFGFAKVTRDLTERMRAQERALQSERLAAIGQMVAGVAHESRNALQQILASAEMLKRRLPAGPEVTLVGEIVKANNRVHRLLEDVRTYAAPLNLACETRDLADLWQEAWRQLAPLRQGRVAYFHEDAAGLDLRCLVDPFRIERLFRNLLENALAACGDPVKIEVRCAATELDGQPAIRIRVADNGPGLTAEQKQRVFQPFFTTKTSGTGLGLAIARRIVEAHGGRIGLSEGTSPGAVIELHLPRGQS
jgi:PAS domain S-box-containing protein